MTFFEDILSGGLLTRSLLAMLLGSIACGIVGSYVVVRRNSYMVGAISHSLLGGVGIALFLNLTRGWTWFSPWTGALAASVIVAVILTLMTQKWHAREDTILSAIWATGMAVGISFVLAIPGYPQDLNSYLFGTILIISPQDIRMIGILDAVILIMTLFCHQRFTVLCFNPELLTLRGINRTNTTLYLNILIALTIVILAQMVGIILCMALLILPVATAAAISRRLPFIMVIGAIICFFCAFTGVALSYHQLPNGLILSPGATIIELAAALFLIASAVNALRRSFKCLIKGQRD